MKIRFIWGEKWEYHFLIFEGVLYLLKENTVDFRPVNKIISLSYNPEYIEWIKEMDMRQDKSDHIHKAGVDTFLHKFYREEGKNWFQSKTHSLNNKYFIELKMALNKLQHESN